MSLTARIITFALAIVLYCTGMTALALINGDFADASEWEAQQ